MKEYIRPFPQPDGTTKICEARKINGVVVRMPTRYVRADGTEAQPAAAVQAKPEPRRIEPKQTNAPKRERATPARVTFYDCVHSEGSTGETTKHLCGGCPGGQIVTIFQCELFGDCLPAAWAPTPDSTARRCADCGAYSRSSPPAPPAE